MKLVRFTKSNGEHVWINPETVTSVEKSNGDQTRVDFVGTSHGYVQESLDEVVEALTGPYIVHGYSGVG